MVSSALASRALTPSGRRRPAGSRDHIPPESECVEPLRVSSKPTLLKPKNPPEGGFLILVGPGGWFRARLPRALSPLRGAVAALWRPKCSCSRILSNHCGSHPSRPSKTKKPRYREALLVLVGPGGFEPPTSTMSRLPRLTTTRVDTFKLAYFSLS